MTKFITTSHANDCMSTRSSQFEAGMVVYHRDGKSDLLPYQTSFQSPALFCFPLLDWTWFSRYPIALEGESFSRAKKVGKWNGSAIGYHFMIYSVLPSLHVNCMLENMAAAQRTRVQCIASCIALS